MESSESNLSSSQVTLGEDPLNALARSFPITKPEECKEEVPMEESEAQVRPEIEE
jgi:hypothetical protein